MTETNTTAPASATDATATAPASVTGFIQPAPLYFAVTNGTKNNAGNLAIIGWCRQGLGEQPAPQEGYTYHPLAEMTEEGWNTPSRWETAKSLTAEGVIVEQAEG